MLCVLACALTTVLVTIEGDAVLVTEQDLIFYWFTVLYVCCYGALFVGTRLLVRLGVLSKGGPPFYNLLAGVLLLVATTTYLVRDMIRRTRNCTSGMTQLLKMERGGIKN